jgi:uncharacterized membrane protein YeaQ/YmgE (transglycosylase-associated protein family)
MSGMDFAVVLSPMGIVAWLVIGLIAGWLANMLMRRNRYGILGEIVIGLVGSFLGGLFLCSFVEGPAGFWGSIVVAMICACALIVLMRMVGRRQTALRL